MLAVGALETWTWWPHLSNFRLDVLIVVFSGSDSFSSMPNDVHAEEKQARLEGELKCKSEEIGLRVTKRTVP